MKIALIIAAALILLVFIFLLIPTYCILEFIKKGAEKKNEIRIKYLFFSFKPGGKPKKKKPEKEEKKEKGKGKRKVSEWLSVFREIEDDLIGILQYAKKHAVAVKYLKFIMDFGMPDAMQTGIATGAAYGTVYNVLGFLNRNIPVEECEIKINPDFERTHLEIDIKCIFRIKNVHIIVIAVKALKLYIKKIKKQKRKEV